MTPKQKAAELVAKFLEHAEIRLNDDSVFSKLPEAKQCALIAVEEILASMPTKPSPTHICQDADIVKAGMYWIEVKTEIEAL